MKIFNNYKPNKIIMGKLLVFAGYLFLESCGLATTADQAKESNIRERISIDDNWNFLNTNLADKADNLIYDVRPAVRNYRDDKDADSKPTDAQLRWKRHREF